MSEKKSRAERLKERQEASGKRGGGKYKKILQLPEDVELFKRKIEETQNIAIVPFVVSEKHPEYKEIKKDADEYGDLPTAYKFDYFIHKGVQGMPEVICNKLTYGKSCAVCDERERIMDEENLDWDDKKVRPYSASHRSAYVICDLDDPENPFYVLDEPNGWFEKVLYAKAEEQNVLLLDESEEGNNLQVFSMEHTFNVQGEDKKMPGKVSIKFTDREWGFTEADMKEIDLASFFTVHTPDEVYELFHGVMGEDSAEDNKEDKAESASSGRASRGASAEAREPNTSSRRGGRGASTDSSEEASTGRGRGRGRGASAETKEEDIAF